MERYITAATIIIVAILAAATALIIAGRSAELERYAIVLVQGATTIVNTYVVWRATRNEGIRTGHKLDEVESRLNGAINGSGQHPKYVAPPPE